MKLRKLYSFAKLALRRLDSPDAYRRFQEYQGDFLVDYLNEFEVGLSSRVVLDMACGYGGYSRTLARNGAKVYGLDLAMNPSLQNQYLCANALVAPFSKGTFDVVVCASLIEHIQDQKELIFEIIRLLKVGGYGYISFPPFYSPIGGHQFSPYHLLGEKAALWFANHRQLYPQQWLNEKFPAKIDSYQHAFGDWGLFPTTIRKIRDLLDQSPVQMIDQSTRWLPVNFSVIPFLGEFLTWHVQFLFKKKL